MRRHPSSAIANRLIRERQVKLMYYIAGWLAAFSVLLMYFKIGGGSSNYISFIALAFSAYVAVASLMFSRFQQQKRRRERVFIIYSPSDLDKAQLISKALRERGFSPWLDIQRIRPGQRWQAVIEDGISECAAAVLLVSANLDIADKRIAQEIDIAMKTMKSIDKTFSPVIPVLLDDTSVPEFLKDVYAAKLEMPDDIDGLAQGLVQILQGA
jgi:hypothetical protein